MLKPKTITLHFTLDDSKAYPWLCGCDANATFAKGATMEEALAGWIQVQVVTVINEIGKEADRDR